MQDVLGVVDLSISLLSFTNLELRSQGYYAVRTRILPDPRIKAVWPHSMILSEGMGQPTPSPRGRAEEGWSWHSKVFAIRYTHEEVPLGECPCFQVFLRNPADALENVSIQIEIELLHQEVDIISNPTVPSILHLKAAARDTIRLSHVCEGIACYYPATWGPSYFGLAHMSFYAVLSGFMPARMLHNLRASAGRDLRRPLSQRMPSRKFERSISISSDTKAETSSKKAGGGWRALRCSNPDPDQVAAPSPKPLTGIDAVKVDAEAADRENSASQWHQQQGPHNLVGVLQAAVNGDGLPDDPDATLSEAQQARLHALYESLVITQRRAVFFVSRTLKALPSSCFKPQSYEVLRTLMAKSGPPSGTSPETSPHSSKPASAFNLRAAASPGFNPSPNPSPLGAHSRLAACGSARKSGSDERGRSSERGSSSTDRGGQDERARDQVSGTDARTQHADGKGVHAAHGAHGGAPHKLCEGHRPPEAHGGQGVGHGSGHGGQPVALPPKPQPTSPFERWGRGHEEGDAEGQTVATPEAKDAHGPGSRVHHHTNQTQLGMPPAMQGFGAHRGAKAPTPMMTPPQVNTMSQVGMSAAPSLANEDSPSSHPFSLGMIGRSLGLGDGDTPSTGAKSCSPPPDTTPPGPTPAAKPPLPNHTPPPLLEPPNSADTQPDHTTDVSHTSHHPHRSLSFSRSVFVASNNGDEKSDPVKALPVTPLKIPPLPIEAPGTEGGSHGGSHPEEECEQPPTPTGGGKIVACAGEHRGSAVAVPRTQTWQLGKAASGALPPLQSARRSRKEQRSKMVSGKQAPGEEDQASIQGPGTEVEFPAPRSSKDSSRPFSFWQLQRKQSGKSHPSSIAGSESTSIAAEVASWPEIPDAAKFPSLLPPECSLGTAVLYLDAVLSQLRSCAASEWAVLHWVLRMTNAHATKHFKCLWEKEQPWLAQQWVALGVNTSAICAASGLESKAREVRQSLLERLRSHELLPPQVYQPRVWEYPSHQPVLLVDDSQAPHVSTWCTRDEPSQQELPPNSPSTGKPRTHKRADPEPDSLNCYTNNNAGTHVCVFVHGYQGAPTDMSLLKGMLGMLYPHIDMVCSKANEGKTQDSLQQMGERLATEVAEKLAPLCEPNQKRPLAALSFVGHSLGTLVTRAALASPKMAPYLPKLELFVSICGPHLGQVYSGNNLVDVGFGFLKVVSNKGSCLHQLALTDGGSNTRQSWLYKLATSAPHGPGSLQLFKTVLLVASAQDRYVPLHSARVAGCDAIQADSNKQRSAAYAEMLEASSKGFGGGPGTPQLLRVDVDFPSQGNNASFFNNLLGRTAHIALIEDVQFAYFLVWGVIRRYKLIRPDVMGAWLK